MPSDSARSRRPHAALLVAATCVALLASREARADVPPPDGQKFVGFSFKVTGLSKAPDQVLFAFPCGDSNGAPIATLTVVSENKPVSVGRRGGSCALYTTTKAKYDEWAKTYKPASSMQDPEAEAFANAATKCQGAPTPSFVLSSSDSRSNIEEVLEVVSLSATECVIRSKSPPASSAASSSSAKKGCSASGTAFDATSWLLAVAASTVGAGVRRRRCRARR